MNKNIKTEKVIVNPRNKAIEDQASNPKLTKKKLQEKIELIEQRIRLSQIQESLNRGRSITVGNAFGGVIEVQIRKIDGESIFVLLQPVEAIELIHQMAACAGCHIAIKPRDDFSSWRKWNEERPNVIGSEWAPHAVWSYENLKLGTIRPGIQDQPALMARSESNEQTLATQKTVGRKRTKRAAAAA